MGMRNHNHRLVKIHRTYTVEEMATLFDTHRNTVRGWLDKGLTTIDQHRPLLVRGQVLVDFLKFRRAANKRPCRPGQIYCVSCREPQTPVDARAAYQPLTPTVGNLVGICPHCGSRIFRRVNLAKLTHVAGHLYVTSPEAQQHIDESHKPSVNCDFRQDVADHD
jgi:hypothetical protein